jgi:hypothetical protein
MTALLAALLLATLATSAPPQRKRAPVVTEAVATALNPRSPDIEIVVVGAVEDTAPGGANVLELGRVSYQPRKDAGRRSARATLLRRIVTVRIGTARSGFAPLRAALSGDDGRCLVRVDGKTLTAVPQVIDPLAPLGQAVTHVIEIEIAATASEGPVSASISWTADALNTGDPR